MLNVGLWHMVPPLNRSKWKKNPQKSWNWQSCKRHALVTEDLIKRSKVKDQGHMSQVNAKVTCHKLIGYQQGCHSRLWAFCVHSSDVVPRWMWAFCVLSELSRGNHAIHEGVSWCLPLVVAASGWCHGLSNMCPHHLKGHSLLRLPPGLVPAKFITSVYHAKFITSKLLIRWC